MLKNKKCYCLLTLLPMATKRVAMFTGKHVANTKERIQNMMHRGVFLTNLKVFRNVFKLDFSSHGNLTNIFDEP